jgi:hypothetical protein
MAMLIPERDSALEAELRLILDGIVVEFAGAYRSHGSGQRVDERVSGAARLEQLLDEGGRHLDRAVSAHRQAAHAAAQQAEALAAFARSRPSSLDRPDAEVGAAAARTRAGRPAALTEVSEWAVDEVAVALRRPQRPRARCSSTRYCSPSGCRPPSRRCARVASAGGTPR